MRLAFTAALIFWLMPESAVAIDIPRAALAYRATLTREAHFAMGLDAPIAVLGAQVHQESGWNPNAKSAFAGGLAQFTPATAEWISGAYKSLGPAAPFNPTWALRAMVTYDKRLHDAVQAFDSDCDRWQFSMSDYNGGTGRRIRRQALSTMPGSYAVTGKINPGISASSQRENEGYGPRILFVLQPLYAAWGPGVHCNQPQEK